MPVGAAPRSASAPRHRPLPWQVRGELGAGATQRIMGLNVTIFYVEPPQAMLGVDSR